MPFESGAPIAGGIVPLSVPCIRGNEWHYMKECLDSGWVSSAGAFVDRFERELAAYVGSAHAVATVNGTAALHTALLVAGIGQDDEVLVPALTFIAPANAVRYVGAWPVFVDIEPAFWQMDASQAEAFLVNGCECVSGELRNRKTGRHVRAMIPVHVLGHPVDMDPLLDLADRFNLVIIEDATESLGASYRGRSTGAIGHIGCFSFNGNKIITTGGGGMIVTNNSAWAERARYLTTQAKDDPVEYIHAAIGYNHRLTNLQAAMGCAQLEQLESFIADKRRIAGTYCRAFERLPGVQCHASAPWAESTYWLSAIRIDRAFGMDRRQLMKALSIQGIQTRPLWKPLPRNPVYELLKAACPVADEIQESVLCLPSSVGLTAPDQARVIDAVIGGGPAQSSH